MQRKVFTALFITCFFVCCEACIKLRYVGTKTAIPTNPCPSGMDWVKIDAGGSSGQWKSGSTGYDIDGSTMTVTWGNTQGKYSVSSWTSAGDVSVDFMVLKCATSDVFYWYWPSAYSDSSMTTACQVGTGQAKDTSHVSFCHINRKELKVSGDDIEVNANEMYEWFVSKTIQPPSVVVMPIPGITIPPIATITYWSSQSYVSCEMDINSDVHISNTYGQTATVTQVNATITLVNGTLIQTGNILTSPIMIQSHSEYIVHFSESYFSSTHQDVPVYLEISVITDSSGCTYVYPECSDPSVPKSVSCLLNIVPVGGTCPPTSSGICGAKWEIQVTQHVNETKLPCVNVEDTTGCDGQQRTSRQLDTHLCPPITLKTLSYQVQIPDADMCNTAVCDTARVCASDLCIPAHAQLQLTCPQPYTGCCYTIGFWKTHSGGVYGGQNDFVYDYFDIGPLKDQELMIGSNTLGSQTCDSVPHGVVPLGTSCSACNCQGTRVATTSSEVSTWLNPESSFNSACNTSKSNIRRQLWAQLTGAELNVALIWYNADGTHTNQMPPSMAYINMPPLVRTAMCDAHHILCTFTCQTWEPPKSGPKTGQYATTVKFPGTTYTYYDRAIAAKAAIEKWNQGLYTGYQVHCE
jgi:hypothetical protein